MTNILFLGVNTAVTLNDFNLCDFLELYFKIKPLDENTTTIHIEVRLLGF